MVNTNTAFCITNYDNYNLVTTDTTANINFNDSTTQASIDENFAIISIETHNTFDTEVLKLTSLIIGMNPSFDIHNFTSTKINNNFDINQIINNFDINSSTTTSPFID